VWGSMQRKGGGGRRGRTGAGAVKGEEEVGKGWGGKYRREKYIGIYYTKR